MRLTRRDALAALGAAGVGSGGVAALSWATADGDGSGDGDGTGGERPLAESAVGTLVAAAEVLYPSEIEGTAAFVREYARRRAAARPDHAAGVAAAVAYLDDYAAAWYDGEFAALPRADRDGALREMGADTADPDPEGSDVERVRYYVVNDLLFALYASPTGGELLGLENPQGHPGGIDSYRRGPG